MDGNVSATAFAAGSDLAPYIREEADGERSLSLLVDGMHCAGCQNRIEKRLRQMPGVVVGRVNLTARRLALRWKSEEVGADAIRDAVEALGLGENGRYIAALTFGNVHGVYKPGGVKLRPELLGEIQAGIAEKFGTGEKPLDLVFHGGSGSTDAEIAEAVSNGVVKMNIDTDTQYAFTRAIAGYMFANYDEVLKVDGEVGNKKKYDPRAWGKIAESAMAARVVESTKQLGSFGHSKS